VLFEIPALQKLAQSIYIDVISRFSNRLYAMQFQTAKERYDSLMELHPDIILRAPLGHIASYLGITQQTLSVIRAEKG
ncbi:MAG TPA: Crp/Fnr family transcriptional regulator, partial [Bacteroidia bacterium]